MIDERRLASPPRSHAETFNGLSIVLRPLFHPRRADPADRAITDLLLMLCSVPYERAERALHDRRTGARRSPEPQDHLNAGPALAEAL